MYVKMFHSFAAWDLKPTFANCTSLLLGSREVVSSTLGSASPAWAYLNGNL